MPNSILYGWLPPNWTCVKGGLTCRVTSSTTASLLQTEAVRVERPLPISWRPPFVLWWLSFALWWWDFGTNFDLGLDKLLVLLFATFLPASNLSHIRKAREAIGGAVVTPSLFLVGLFHNLNTNVANLFRQTLKKYVKITYLPFSKEISYIFRIFYIFPT